MWFVVRTSAAWGCAASRSTLERNVAADRLAAIQTWQCATTRALRARRCTNCRAAAGIGPVWGRWGDARRSTITAHTPFLVARQGVPTELSEPLLIPQSYLQR